MAISTVTAQKILPVLNQNISQSSLKATAKSTFQSLLVSSMAGTISSSAMVGESSSAAIASLGGGAFGLTGGEEGIINALLMLCMLLSAGNETTGTSELMARITGALNGTDTATIENIRTKVLNSDNSSEVLEKINDTFFGDSSDSIIPYNASKAVTPAITSNPNNRSAALYRAVINQFSVETNPRYKVNKNGNNETYCNIFLWDVTRAMGAEIPHYIDPETKAPRYYPDVKGASQLNANGIYNWLLNYGEKYGWRQVTAEEAQNLANQGHPVVTAKKNPGRHGHVQIVCPSKNGEYDQSRGVTIAQAGSHLYNYTYIDNVYSDSSLSNVLYFAHD